MVLCECCWQRGWVGSGPMPWSRALQSLLLTFSRSLCPEALPAALAPCPRLPLLPFCKTPACVSAVQAMSRLRWGPGVGRPVRGSSAGKARAGPLPLPSADPPCCPPSLNADSWCQAPRGPLGPQVKVTGSQTRFPESRGPRGTPRPGTGRARESVSGLHLSPREPQIGEMTCGCGGRPGSGSRSGARPPLEEAWEAFLRRRL